MLLLSVLYLTTPGPVFAQTGVDDDRVSLPEGPGSLEGVGDDVDVDPNMGSMSHRVAIDLPSGFAGASPSLALVYSSSAGSSTLGMGWSMAIPSIERMTSRGVPTYDTDDLFDTGGAELVQVGEDGGDLIYRQRFEGSFVRYRWVDAGVGDEGHWIAEYPDGSRGYFGADGQGARVDGARTLHPTRGTAAYHLVEKIDPFGNSVRYDYERLDGSVPLISQITWLDDGAGTPLYTVEIEYEGRPDFISDASRNIEEVIANRVKYLRVRFKEETIREYALTYEEAGTSGGFSRLRKVEKYGRGGRLITAPFPIAHSFEYTQALGMQCVGPDCARPYMVEMGAGIDGAANFATGRATLIDIDKDGLADIVDTTGDGEHRFYINTLTPDGSGEFDHTFASSITSASPSGRGSVIQLGGVVQTFDVNGDGTSDLLNTTTGQYLLNDPASDDWGAAGTLADATALQNIDLSQARFIDLDDDKRVDLLTSTTTTTTYHRNAGDTFITSQIAPIGAAVQADSRVQFADMNGDGLNDPVELRQDGSLRYRLNYGLGDWGPWRNVVGLTLTPTERDRADLEDLNGDGIADVVIVNDGEVKYALNANGDAFEAMQMLTSADIDGVTIPDRGAGVSVLFADMNANGSEDVVWFLPGGRIQYLELFPVRPNLLTRIDNGIGFVQRITYTTAAEEAARARDAGQPWTHHLQIPMQMVHTIDRFVTLTGSDDGSGLHEITEHLYRDGFYDGIEKQFRGFERVEVSVREDAFHEGSLTSYLFDVGREKPHFNGLALEVEHRGGEDVLTRTTNVYSECDVAEVPSATEQEAMGRMPVRYPCNTATEVTHIERETSEAAWKTVRDETTFDGYGNQTLVAQLGEIDVEGDELYQSTTFAAPTTRWLLRLPVRQETYTTQAGARATTINYYDGEDFIGLPEGEATHGFLSRVEKVVAEGETIVTARARRDAFGNGVEQILPNGTLDNLNTHRVQLTYDASGRFLLAEDRLNLDDDQEPYTVRREFRHDRGFQRETETTQPFITRGGEAVTSKNTSRKQLDEFGRVTQIFDSGDAPDKPSTTYTYELGETFSRIIVDSRIEAGGDEMARMVWCVDGKGRAYQKRSSIDDSTYQVGGTSVFNARGSVVEAYQPYLSESDACDLEVPEGTLKTTYRYDGLGRTIEKINPGAPIYGEDLPERTVYKPLVVEVHDGADTSDGEHANTPTIRTNDGLGRLVMIERTEMKDGVLVSSGARAYYDETGTFAGYQDADGNRHLVESDLAGRITSVTNPSFGTMTMTYDDASNVTSRTDARGVTVRFEYEGQNRLKYRYDESDRDGTLLEWHHDFAPDGCDVTECTNVAGMKGGVSYAMRLGDEVQTGKDMFGYDARRRRVFAARELGELARLETRYVYDNKDRLIQKTHPDGTVVEKRYDEMGRPVMIPGFVSEILYSPRNQIASVSYANGARHRREYDALVRVQRAEATDAAGGLIYALEPTFNRADVVRSITDSAPDNMLGVDYTIDDWYRTSAARYKDTQASYTFDELDRITGITSGEDSWAATYDEARPHHLRQLGEIQYEYDEGGNLVRRADLTIARDELGRSAVLERDGVTEQHLYGEISRVAKITSAGELVLYGFDRFEVRDGVANTYIEAMTKRDVRHATTALMTGIYPDGDGDGVITAADAYAMRAEGALAPEHVLGAAAARMLAEREGERTYIHRDLLGSAVAATDEEGAVRGRQAFHAFGELRYSEGFVDPYGFTGQERDATSGFLHMTHRNLDTRSGRWDRFDPAFVVIDAEALNNLGEATTGYAYAGNRASDQVDPTGLSRKGIKQLKGVTGADKATIQWSAKEVRINWRDEDTGKLKGATFKRRIPGPWATRGKKVAGAIGSVMRTLPVLSYLIRANDKRKMRLLYGRKGADEFFASQTQWRNDPPGLYTLFRDKERRKIDSDTKMTKTFRALKKYSEVNREGLSVSERRIVARFLTGNPDVPLSSYREPSMEGSEVMMAVTVVPDGDDDDDDDD